MSDFTALAEWLLTALASALMSPPYIYFVGCFITFIVIKIFKSLL